MNQPPVNRSERCGKNPVADCYLHVLEGASHAWPGYGKWATSAVGCVLPLSR
ncbi:MAG: hypothetical protein JWQ50_3569 [Caballeronia mineralivorans]|nr:hypothetical protein [Caballeronia mineralivorans]